jgi:Tfp pilus assembly protein PilO
MKLMISLDDSPTRSELVLFAIILLATVLTSTRMLYTPQLQETTQLKSQIKNLNMEKNAIYKFREAIQKKAEVVDQPKIEYANVYLQILSGQRMSAVKGLTDLVGYLTTDTLARGVELKSINYEPIQQTQGYGSTAITVQGMGEYQSIIDYIERIEELETLLHMTNISLSVDTKLIPSVAFDLKAQYYEVGRKNHDV